MNRSDAQVEIRRLVAAGRLELTRHSKLRDPPRGKYPLTQPQIEAVMLYGAIVEGPAEDIRAGWKFTMRRAREGAKAEVAGILHPGDRVRVITGYGTG